MASTPPRLLKRPKLESGGDDNGDGDTTVQEQEANLLTLIDHCYNEVEHLQRRMAHFPPQIVEEVLYRLSTKSLVRFRCLSKHWNQIICDPYLINKGLINGGVRKEDSRVVCISTHYYGHFSKKISKNVINMVKPDKYLMECCCDGLYCFSNGKKPGIVHNLLKGETLKLPRDLLMDNLYMKPSCYGLGFDSKIGRFKVVRIGFSGDLMTAKVLILGEDCWKQVELPAPLVEGIQHHESFFLNGSVFRFTCLPQTKSYVVSAFDIETEVFSWLDLPFDMYKNKDRTVLMELGGRLAVAEFVSQIGPDLTNIWVLRGNNYRSPEWSLHCTVHHSYVSSGRFWVPKFFKLVGHWKSDHVLFGSYLLKYFLSISIHTGNIEEVISHDEDLCVGNHRVFSNPLSLIPLL